MYESVYISVWTFFSVKNVCDLQVCVCLICCCRSEWEAATLFGNEECFPCLSPPASALAALSVYKMLSAIVLLHRTAAGVEETTTGPFTFSPFLTTLNHLSLWYTFGLGTVQGLVRPLRQILSWTVRGVKPIIDPGSVLTGQSLSPQIPFC